MTRSRWLVLATALPLAACNPFSSGDGPSEADITAALTKSGLKVQSAERIACKPAPDRPGYVCDFRATTCSPFTGKCDKSATRTGRFVLFGDNWVFRDDVADPNRYSPAPEPSPSDTSTVTDLNPTPTPSPTATPSPRPTPTPSATPTPKESPTPKVSPTPKATPTPKPSPSPSATPTAKPTPAGVNRTWLSGRWGAEAGDCTARKAVNFGSGGGFYGKRGTGRWSLDGKTVKVTGNYSTDDKPFDQTLKVERTGADTMTMEGKRYHRCPN